MGQIEVQVGFIARLLRWLGVYRDRGPTERPRQPTLAQTTPSHAATSHAISSRSPAGQARTPQAEPLLSTKQAAIDVDMLQAALVDRVSLLLTHAELENDRITLEQLRDAVFARAIDLPRFPAVAEELLRLDVNSPESGDRVAELVGRDQDLAARVMQVAGSAAYGRTPPRSLAQAVARLGFESVRGFAIGLSMHGVVYRVPGYDREAAELRDAAIVSATQVSAVARAVGRSGDAGLAFLGGLFKDVGQVLIFRNLSLVRSRTRGGAASALLVRRLLADLHTPLGAFYALHRELPAPVVAAAWGHHDPTTAPADDAWLAWLVWACAEVSETLGESPAKLEAHKALAARWPEGAPNFDRVVLTLRELAGPA
jgi:HD-like signal output (HDOD) protein